MTTTAAEIKQETKDTLTYTSTTTTLTNTTNSSGTVAFAMAQTPQLQLQIAPYKPKEDNWNRWSQRLDNAFKT